MELSFAIIAVVILVSAGAAMALRNLVHCALCLTVTFIGLAALFLQLDAEFIGFAQILVYVGAVAILILFTILLTRSGEQKVAGPYLSPGWTGGLVVAGLTFLALLTAIHSSSEVALEATALPEITVKSIGQQLMYRPDSEPNSYIVPLLVMGILLTAAMIGAVIIAMQERKEP